MRPPRRPRTATSGPAVGVIQARMGSSRLPGKVLSDIGGRPLIEWTIAAMEAVPSLHALVVAITADPEDDELAAALADKVAVHRGPTFDVLTRCWDAVAPYAPAIVVRETADNPFVDPDIVESQIAMLRQGFDYVGSSGWPRGITAEVAAAAALGQAASEARDPAEREHVMPFLYGRPERFRIGMLPSPVNPAHHRYTVDTAADLAFARAVAGRLGHGPPAHFAEIEAIVRAEPELASLNAVVRQKAWREVDERAKGAS